MNMRSTDYISKGTAVARLYKNMVKVETLKEDGFVRILRCREGYRIWYQMWLTDLEKACIDRYFLPGIEVKYWWLGNLQRWYVFFYEKNNRRVRGVLGKDRTKDLLRSLL